MRPSTHRRLVVFGGIVALAMPAFNLVDAPTAGSAASTSGYHRFASCASFLGYVREQALPKVWAYGLEGLEDVGGPVTEETEEEERPAPIGTVVPQGTVPPGTHSPTTAAPATTAAPTTAAPAALPTGSSSSTNVQEAGVDEGDVVENDGRRVYSVVDGRLRVVDTLLGGRELWVGDLPEGSHQLLLDRRRLAVITDAWVSEAPEVIVSLYDVSLPRAPVLLRRTHLEGRAIATRTVDHRARIVLTAPFGRRLPFTRPSSPDPGSSQNSTAANRRVVSAATAETWLPRLYVERPNGTRTEPRQAVACSEVGRPAKFSGLGMTWVATIDLDVPNARAVAVGSAAVLAAGGTVYASSRALYVGTRVYSDDWPGDDTSIHAFSLEPADGAKYLASGTVGGTVLNQFSMSEHRGYLRVATTTTSAWPPESGVHVLARSGRRLLEVGSVTGLGRSEQIFGVRFVGDLGYVVTFRQTDPLYVVDLRNPRRPTLAGELKIPGYSAYLQPIGDGLLLGIGQDATLQGTRLGTQVALFDVSDPRTPTRLASLTVGGSSEAEYDHHAFLWWAPTRTVFVPSLRSQGFDAARKPVDAFAGVLALSVERSAISERGRISHPAPTTATRTLCTPSGCVNVPPGFATIRRSLIVRDRLVTVSQRGVKVSGLTAFDDLSWIPFGR